MIFILIALRNVGCGAAASSTKATSVTLIVDYIVIYLHCEV